MIKIRTPEELALGKPRAQYTDWSPEALKREIRKLKEEIKEIRRERIDKLWPTYYSAQLALARNSMDAMTKVLKCKDIRAVKMIAEVEIAALIELISELENEEASQDIVIKL